MFKFLQNWPWHRNLFSKTLLFYCIPWLTRHVLLYCSAIHTQGDIELERYVDTPVFTVRLRLTLLWDKTCCFWDVNQNIITLAVSGLYQRKPRRLTAGETFGCFLWNCEQERVDQCLTCFSNFYLMSAFLESSEFFSPQVFQLPERPTQAEMFWSQ